MFDLEQIPRLIRDKFIQVAETIEEDAHDVSLLVEFVKGEIHFVLGHDHVVHLAEEVDEEDGLVVQRF